MQTLGQRVKARLAELGISQKELAAKAGLTESDVSKIVSGTRQSPGIIVAQQLARGLGWNTSQLLGELPSEEPESVRRSRLITELGPIVEIFAYHALSRLCVDFKVDFADLPEQYQAAVLDMVAESAGDLKRRRAGPPLRVLGDGPPTKRQHEPAYGYHVKEVNTEVAEVDHGLVEELMAAGLPDIELRRLQDVWPETPTSERVALLRMAYELAEAYHAFHAPGDLQPKRGQAPAHPEPT